MQSTRLKHRHISEGSDKSLLSSGNNVGYLQVLVKRIALRDSRRQRGPFHDRYPACRVYVSWAMTGRKCCVDFPCNPGSYDMITDCLLSRWIADVPPVITKGEKSLCRLGRRRRAGYKAAGARPAIRPPAPGRLCRAACMARRSREGEA